MGQAHSPGLSVLCRRPAVAARGPASQHDPKLVVAPSEEMGSGLQCLSQCWAFLAKAARWGGLAGAGVLVGWFGQTPAGRGTQGAPEPTILGHLLQLPDAGVVFIAASGQRAGSSQQEPRRRQPLRSSRPPSPFSLTPSPHSCGVSRCHHAASPGPGGDQVPPSAWQAPLPSLVWPGLCLSPRPPWASH